MADQIQAHAESAQGKYVYCIIRTEAPRDFRTVGMGGRAGRATPSITASSRPSFRTAR